jgi:Protein of unknown function (DUF3429)
MLQLLSFLGAIHWGLEFAGYGGYQKYRRYAIGVVATAVAWPTTLLPIEYALITQFLAFNFLYFADARASMKGWMPPWYGTYRFVLTFIVGASIVMSLVGIGQIGDHLLRAPQASERVRKLEMEMWKAEKEEEEMKRKKIVEQEESEEEDDAEGENDKKEEDDDKEDDE